MDGCRGANCNAVLSLWNLAASDGAANIVRSAMKRTLEDIVNFYKIVRKSIEC